MCFDVTGRPLMYIQYCLHFEIIMNFSKKISFVVWLLLRCTVEIIWGEWFDYLWRLWLNFLSETFFFLITTPEVKAFVLNVTSSLVLLPRAFVCFPPCGEIMTPSGKCAFDFRAMSHILFRSSASSSRERVLVAFISLKGGSSVELVTMLQANVTFSIFVSDAVARRVEKWTWREAIVLAFVCISCQ